MSGGKRTGSGRKPKYGVPMVRVQLLMPAEVVKTLDSLGANRCETVLRMLASANQDIADAIHSPIT